MPTVTRWNHITLDDARTRFPDGRHMTPDGIVWHGRNRVAFIGAFVWPV